MKKYNLIKRIKFWIRFPTLFAPYNFCMKIFRKLKDIYWQLTDKCFIDYPPFYQCCCKCNSHFPVIKYIKGKNKIMGYVCLMPLHYDKDDPQPYACHSRKHSVGCECFSKKDVKDSYGWISVEERYPTETDECIEVCKPAYKDTNGTLTWQTSYQDYYHPSTEEWQFEQGWTHWRHQRPLPRE